MASHLQTTIYPRSEFSCNYVNHPIKRHLPLFISFPDSRTLKGKSWKIVQSLCSASTTCNQSNVNFPSDGNSCKHMSGKKRVFFLDVNPLCYKGSTPSLQNFAHWISLFLSKVSLNDPVIAVVDGEGGNAYRRQLLPSYKANRRVVSRFSSNRFLRSSFGGSQKLVADVLQKCNVPVVKIKGQEADDVVATLVHQVLQKGYRAVIASPDKDFKQLISEDVQLVIPVDKLERWSFYTIKNYMSDYRCDPQSDLSLRCILGDKIDGVPGLQHLVPGFGKRTALKLLRKHGSLEKLLGAASVRTVGRAYAQEALTRYGDFLRKNYEVLSLKRDVDIQIKDEWLCRRDDGNDSIMLSNFMSKTHDLKLDNI